jgi:hypothetical protein
MEHLISSNRLVEKPNEHPTRKGKANLRKGIVDSRFIRQILTQKNEYLTDY